MSLVKPIAKGGAIALLFFLFIGVSLSGEVFFLQKQDAPTWGFFGHRRINRLASFTLPPGLALFYKKNLEYITEHAVDPDKRRYASRHEAGRHFIDLDRYGVFPFGSLPRSWSNACARLSDVYVITPAGDSILLFGYEEIEERAGRYFFRDSTQPGAAFWPSQGLDIRAYQRWFQQTLGPQFYEETWHTGCDSVQAMLGKTFPCREILGIDTFSTHGILPYHLAQMQRRLTTAFEQGNAAAILRISADFGHYIADAHVPLHTTSNYNGQLTGQLGIHAFWESRVPELFADARYNFFVGQATYIADPEAYFWNIVLESHTLADSVLAVEHILRATFPSDRQFCQEGRGGQSVRIQCPEYALAFQNRLGGMVERRMRQAVHAVGSAWFTAWMDAGQPNLARLQHKPDSEEAALYNALQGVWRKGKGYGREHE